ncbi:MAG: hypothetical protein Q7S09_05635 [bacterium]|nr:hypothetical protein [bacterium]
MGGFIAFLLIIGGIWWFYDSGPSKKELQSQLDYCESRGDSLAYRLDDANSGIEEAKSYAWSSYEDMSWALDNLETY